MMMDFRKWAVLCLVALLMSAPIDALAASVGLTRSGNQIGMRNIPVKKGLDNEMRRFGVPDQCRMEAHQVLSKYIVYGYHDARAELPILDIACDFIPVADTAASPDAAKATGFAGKKLGQKGVPGGLSYVRFRNKSGKDIERFVLRRPNDPDPMECRRDKICIKFSSGGRATVVDTTMGPVEKIDPAKIDLNNYDVDQEVISSIQSSKGGMFARISTVAAQRPYFLMVAEVIQGGRISSHMGHRESPGGVGSTEHKGVDYAAACGTPIRSFADGVVIQNTTQIIDKPNGKKGGAGHYVRIRHADETITEYFHMEKQSTLAVGTQVTEGQNIGNVGNTGGSTGCHLHFGAFRMENGKRQYLDPETMKVPTGDVHPLTDTERNNLNNAIKKADDAEFNDGGASADFVEGALYCITGVSPASYGCYDPAEAYEEEEGHDHYDDHDDDAVHSHY